MCILIQEVKKSKILLGKAGILKDEEEENVSPFFVANVRHFLLCGRFVALCKRNTRQYAIWQTWGDYFPNVMITIILLCHDYNYNYDYTIKL